MLNVALLGYGKMGKVYAHCFANNSNTRLIGVYNHSEQRRRELEEAYPGVEYYTDWRELIAKPEIQVVGICTSTDQRFEQMKFCLEHEKHIICEKAMCLDVDQANQLKQLIAEANCCVQVASELELHPVIQTVTDNLPRIGRIVYAEMELSMYREEVKWKHRMNAGGGILRELGQHFLDVASNWFGTPVSISGFNKIVLPHRETEDIAVNMVQYDSGTMLLLKNNYFEHANNTYRGSLYGVKGQIDFELSSYDTEVRKVVIYENPDDIHVIPVSLPQQGNDIYPGHMDTFQREIDHFIENVLNGEKDMHSILRECECISTVCGAYLSAGKGPVQLPLACFSHHLLPDLYLK